jgi:hypothetical protein
LRGVGAQLPGAGALEGATLLDAVAEPSPEGLALWFSVTFDEAAAATRAALALKDLLHALKGSRAFWGPLARTARVEEVGNTVVVVRALLDAEGLSRVLGCAAGAGDC